MYFVVNVLIFPCLFNLQNESTFEEITDDEIINSRPLEVTSSSFEVIPSKSTAK